jgi:predicted MFS family arabinose efflux permease
MNHEEWVEKHADYLERGLQVSVGAFTTILGGFLSQVWGSSAALRMPLALALQISGGLFIVSMAITLVRIPRPAIEDTPKLKARRTWWWFLAMIIVFGGFCFLFLYVSSAISENARLP